MTVPVIPLAEQVLGDYLRTHPALTAVTHVGTERQDIPTYPYLRLTTVSAPRPHVWESLASVQVDVVTDTGKAAAAALAEVVASTIPGLGGAAVIDGPRPIPDQLTGTVFYVVTVQLSLLPATGGPDG